ncbi:MAG: peptidoglycan-binding protein [Hyphomicrobiaceae bacterium]|nr:peptidoglycan-binding protein [Hyphomicrobiaceae bacterium]
MRIKLGSSRFYHSTFVPVIAGLAASSLVLTSFAREAEARRGVGLGIGIIAGAALLSAAANAAKNQKRSGGAKHSGTAKRKSVPGAATAAGAGAAGAALASSDSSEVRSVKESLATLDLYTASINGTDDETYRAAIRAYQRSKKVAETGVLDELQAQLLAQEAELVRSKRNILALSLSTKDKDKGKLIQTSLAVLGHYNGKIDGSLGKGTQTAVRTYQTNVGIAASGTLDAASTSQLSTLASQTIEQRVTQIDRQFAQIAALSAGGVVQPASLQPALAPTLLTPAGPVGAATQQFAAIEPLRADAKVTRPYDVAVIVGNKDYRQDGIPAVTFSHRDADMFKSVLVNELGFSPNNIIDARDAGQGDLIAIFGSDGNNRGKVWRLIDGDGRSNVFVFYSGHGAPELKNKSPYIMPVDSNADTIELNGYPLKQLYANLGSLEVQSVAVFLDACFSGRSPAGMLTKSASPVAVTAILPNADLGKKVTVLAAAEGDQLASWDEKGGTGMFTASLVQGLKGAADVNNDGSITAAELHGFVHEKVRSSARREFGRIQTPVVMGDAGRVLHTR